MIFLKMSTCHFALKSLKCPYYAFSNIIFHAVCHVAVCEQKCSAKLSSRPCVIKLLSIKKNKNDSAHIRQNESSGI